MSAGSILQHIILKLVRANQQVGRQLRQPSKKSDRRRRLHFRAEGI